MLFNKLARPIFYARRSLYTPPKITDKYQEYTQFVVTGTNCLLVVSMLGFLEQYNEKIKIIDECNRNLNALLANCVSKPNHRMPSFSIPPINSDHDE